MLKFQTNTLQQERETILSDGQKNFKTKESLVHHEFISIVNVLVFDKINQDLIFI